MSTSTTSIAPEVRLFLAKVRAELADLDPDEVREITDGLEADLGELVAERGPASLGDPVEYADELRLAAGLPTSGGSTKRTGLADRVTGLLDRSHAFADRQIDRLPGDTRPLLAWLRPAWWLARGASLGGAWLALNTSLGVAPLLLSAVAALVSVQVGRGKLWPGGQRGLLARLVVLGLNLAAVITVVMTISTINDARDRYFWSGYNQAMNEQVQYDNSGEPYYADQAGIYSDGHWVSQIFPYDAAGKPLTGVQLFDQTGQPIHVVTQPDCTSTAANPLPPEEPTADGELNYTCQDPETGQALQARIFYPWTNGAAQLYNVFPLTSRPQADPALSPTAFAEQTPPVVGPLPFASVPTVSLPGVATTTDTAAAPEKSK